MKIKSKMFGLMAGALFCAAGILTAQAQNSYITFSVDMGTNILNGNFNPGSGDVVNVRGTFNNWAGTETPLYQEGSSTVYTNTVPDTVDANGYPVLYIFNITGPDAGYEGVASYNNRAAYTPTTPGATLVLPTPFYGESGAKVTNYVTFQVDVSEQIVLGTFTNGISGVEPWGDFNGWAAGKFVLTNNPNILTTNEPSGNVTSNVWMGTFPVVGSPWSAQDFKYVMTNSTSYESVTTINKDSGGNRFFAFNPNSNVTLPLVNFSDEPYAPLSSVTFSVDMSVQLYYGNWVFSDGVYCEGVNNNWNQNSSTAMTNNASASNTNIYYITIICPEGSQQDYKFTYNNGAVVYENPQPPTLVDGSGNRITVIASLSSTNLPTVFFSDLSINDLLSVPVSVTFSVDMADAVEYGTLGDYPGQPFANTLGYVFLNGAWLGWPTWTPVNLSSYELFQEGSSTIYTNTFVIPEGTAIGITYKYGIDGYDDEAPSGQNHVRYVRSTVTGAYSFPTDTFGNQYNEPAFGELSAGSGPALTVPVRWLGAPNVQLQTSTNLATGPWVSHPETGGSVFLGTENPSTNGLISVTNWPASSGSLFFRLIKQ